MDITGNRKGGPKKIGELLVAANVIKKEVLIEALQVSKKSNTRLGRVLMTIGELSEVDLQKAIEVQSLTHQGVITSEFGVKALNLAVKARLDLEEAFRRLGWVPTEEGPSSKHELGELLLKAEVITQLGLEQAEAQSEENSLPLGRCLVLSRALSPTMLSNALTAQVFLRDGKITWDQAIFSLKNAFKKQMTIERSLADSGALRQGDDTIRMGDLLSNAGLVTEGDKISAIEIGLEESKPFGQVLVQSGMISENTLYEGLELQELVAKGLITGAQAADILKEATNKGLPVNQVLSQRMTRMEEIGKINRVIHLLEKAGALNAQMVGQMISGPNAANMTVGEVVLDKDLVDRRIIQGALQGLDLIREDIMKEAHVVKVLRHCLETELEFPEAVEAVVYSPDMEDQELQAQAQQAGWMKKIWGKVKKKD